MMHPEAHEGFGWALEQSGLTTDHPLRILDIGGQNVNGTVHDYFPEGKITTLDLENADIIADAKTWEPDQLFDVVIATEVFEHVRGWFHILDTVEKALDSAGPGVFLSTMASIDRPPHGSTGALLPAPGEYYGNVIPEDLKLALGARFDLYGTYYQYPPGDLYCWARL